MFAVVLLIDVKKNVVVPIDWINNLDLSDTANNGINSSAALTVFYTNNLKTTANFLSPLRTVFVPDEPARYKAQIKKLFGM